MEKRTRIFYWSKRLVIAISFVSIMSVLTLSFAQQVTNLQISGVVTDSRDNQTVPGASVIIKGTTIGTITNQDGTFALTVPANSTLVVSFVGYKTKEIDVAGKTRFNISLEDEWMQLSDVVVIGYGTRSKRDVTTAISSVSSKDIEKTVAMSPQMAMQGTMTGVHVSGNTGNPMDRPTVRIRGTNTWGITEPLYVIDGVAITEFGSGSEGGHAGNQDLRGPLNIMTLIDPNDIESISILKDASAAAIYGVRAANGVVLITTKKGRKDKPTVDFSARYGVQNITQELNWLTTKQYVKFVQDIWATNPDLSPSPENAGLFDPGDSRYLGNSPTYNWQDAIRNKNAPTSDISVRVSGGTDNTDYYISVGRSETDGTLINTNLSRYTGSIKVNTKINDFLKTGINYRLVSADGDYNHMNYLDNVKSAPWQPIYSATGIPGYKGYAYGVGGLQPDGSYSTQKLYGLGTRINHVGRTSVNYNEYKSLRNMGTIYAELTPFKGLSLKYQLDMDIYNTKRKNFADYDAAAFDYTAGNPYEKGGGKSVGNLIYRDMGNFNYMQQFTANFARSFGSHNIDLLYNYTNQEYGAEFSDMSTEYVTSKKKELHNIGGESKFTNSFTGTQRRALQGHLVRGGYNYSYRYYLDVTVRRDGSSRFAPENRWGTFPSFSAAWRMKNESFMSDLSWLDDFKLRGGWGQLGNQEVADMAFLSTIQQTATYNFGSDPSKYFGGGVLGIGAIITGIPNRELRWEKTTTTNIGFDAILFKNLNISAEYYTKLTDGILQHIDLPLSVGVLTLPSANVAEVSNRGIEITSNYSNKLGELNYTVGANLSTVRNRVLKTYKGIPSGTIEEGYPLFYHKAYKVAGVFQSDAEAQDWKSKYSDSNWTQSNKIGAGDFYFKDMRGAPTEDGTFYSNEPDGKIDDYDMVYVGKSIPGYFYGFNLNLEYKGLDFSAIFSGVGDVVKYNVVKANSFHPTQSDNVTTMVYKQWTSENQSSEYPRLVFGDPNKNLRYSDFFFESGAYLRLQNVQLGYTLPVSFYSKLNNQIKNLRMYVAGSNLLTITNYTGIDPESDIYPTPRIFSVGISARF